MDKIVIIDGNSLINRAFYALPPLATKNGKIYNAVFGFVNIVIKLLIEHKPSHIVVAFDAGHKTFRNEIYAEYKGTRKAMPQELYEQFAPLKDLLHEMGIKTLEKLGIEADDIIGTLSKRFDYPSVIVTGDRDCLQLIDNKTEVWLTKHGITDIVSMNERQLKEEMGLIPSQIIDLKSLMGDASDNIPGVPGVGPKTATDLLTKYQTLDGVYQHLDEITGKTHEKLVLNEQSARMSYTLATIDTNCDIPCELSECEYKMPFSTRVKELFQEYEFNSLLKREDLFVAGEQIVKENKKQEIEYINLDDFIAKSRNKTIAILPQEEHIELALDNTICIVDSFEQITNILQDTSITKVFHKLKPLLHKLNICGKSLDLSLAVYLVNSNVKNEDFTKVLEFLDMPSEQNAVTLLQAWNKVNEQLQELKLLDLYYNIELPLVYVLCDMEQQGICIDENVLNELGQKFTEEINNITEQIYYLADTKFNINSPKQLADVLYNKMGLQMKGNKKQSTAVDKLEEIRHLHPIVDLLLRYRTIAKLQSTYIDGMREYIVNGKVHTTFNQTLTTTGRLSSNEPNLQNIPVRTKEGKVLRKMFTASPSCELLSADYSQIELRLLAHYSKDVNLVQAYKENKDIHTTTASQIFNIPFEQVSAEQRRMAKAVNFGIIYGISPYGLSNNTGISVQDAKQYIDMYFKMYPTIKDFLNKSVEQAKELGYVTSLLGRRRPIAEIYSTNHNVAMFGERAAMNMPLQGTASDIIKLAMIEISNKIKEQNLKSKLILQIHDELIFDVPDGEKRIMVNLVKQCMENVVKLEVPLIVDISMGKNWLDCKEVEI